MVACGTHSVFARVGCEHVQPYTANANVNVPENTESVLHIYMRTASLSLASRLIPPPQASRSLHIHLPPHLPISPPPPQNSTRVALSGDALSILHRRFCGQAGCRSAFMRVAGLAGGDLAPGMLEHIVVEMLALPAVSPVFDLSFFW